MNPDSVQKAAEVMAEGGPELETLRAELDALALQKREHEVKLSNLALAVRSQQRLRPERYSQICQEQARRKSAVLEVEKKMAVLRPKVRALHDIAYRAYQERIVAPVAGARENNMVPESVLADLKALSDYYQRFAADPTRVSSMRAMSAEFALKLAPIINRLNWRDKAQGRTGAQ